MDTLPAGIETAETSHASPSGTGPAFRGFLVINGAVLPQIHGSEGEESQQGLPGHPDPQARLGNFSLLIPRQCRHFDV